MEIRGKQSLIGQLTHLESPSKLLLLLLLPQKKAHLCQSLARRRVCRHLMTRLLVRPARREQRQLKPSHQVASLHRDLPVHLEIVLLLLHLLDLPCLLLSHWWLLPADSRKMPRSAPSQRNHSRRTQHLLHPKTANPSSPRRQQQTLNPIVGRARTFLPSPSHLSHPSQHSPKQEVVVVPTPPLYRHPQSPKQNSLHCQTQS